MVAITANRYETKPFWGLVEQVGPWKTTKSDKQRSLMKDHPTIGGGIEAGGRAHAGHGQWTQIFTPYQNDSSPSISSPSDYAMRSVVTGPIDMKRQTKMGRVKKGVTLAARTPLQSGEKMGMSTQTENVEMGQTIGAEPGQRLGTQPGQTMPDLVAESYRSESDYGLPSLEQTAPFLAEHQIAETHEWMNNALARELHNDLMQEPSPPVAKMTQTSGPSLSIKKTGVQAYRPRRGVQATQTRERTFKEFGTQVAGTAAAATLGFIAADVGGAMVAGKKTWDYLAPKDIEMEVDEPKKYAGPVIKVEQKPVPTFKPPPVNLSLSESFMKSIIDYEEGQKVKRKQKMEEGFKERKELVKDKKAIPVPTGEGKKIAMSAKALGKMAEKRGLPEAAKAAGIIPEKPKKTNGLKIKPIKKKTVTGVAKKTVPSQPVTVKVIKSLRKRIGDTKINQMIKTMKETNPQYKIFKAANEQWLKEK